MSSSVEQDDYLDKLSRVLPWHQSLTFYERLLIAFFVAAFVSLVGCILFCLIHSRSSLRRRYCSKKKLDKEQCILVPAAARKDALVFSSPPSYESVVRTDDITALSALNKHRSLKLGSKSSCGTASNSDGVHSNGDGDHPSSTNGKFLHSLSARSSLSNGGIFSRTATTDNYASLPFIQVHVELDFDTTKNLLIIHLSDGDYVSLHPAFDEQADFFIHVQLLNNKILKKFHDLRKKPRSSLQFSTWKKQQEKTTRKLSRTSNDKLICNEYLQFEFSKDEIESTSLRFLFFCIDRSNIQDLMFESVIRLKSIMLQKYQKIMEFKDLPQVTFAEIYLGISYLPTAERLTVKLNKLRYLCRTDKDEKIDARLIATFLHNGRRFFQKKFPPMIFDETLTANRNLYELTETLVQNIPQHDIQSVYVHFELIIRILNSKEQSIISCGTILLGEHTRYQSDWQQMLEHPRQTHLGWYQFFG